MIAAYRSGAARRRGVAGDLERCGGRGPIDFEPHADPIVGALDAPALREDVHDAKAPAAGAPVAGGGQLAGVEAAAAVGDDDPQGCVVCVHGELDGIRVAGVDSVGHEFAEQQLGVAEPRVADEVEVSVERGQGFARGGGGFGAGRQAESVSLRSIRRSYC